MLLVSLLFMTKDSSRQYKVDLLTPEVQKRKGTMEGKIAYDGLSEEEEEEW
jgi:hypothetical protein